MKVIEYGILDKKTLSINEQINIIGGAAGNCKIDVCGAQACASDSCWVNLCGANACIKNWISVCPIYAGLTPPWEPGSELEWEAQLNSGNTGQ